MLLQRDTNTHCPLSQTVLMEEGVGSQTFCACLLFSLALFTQRDSQMSIKGGCDGGGYQGMTHDEVGFPEKSHPASCFAKEKLLYP